MTKTSSFDFPTPVRTDEPPADGLKNLLLELMRGKDLSRAQAGEMLDNLLLDSTNNAQIAAALVALAIKGETTEELAGMAEAMRRHSIKIRSDHAHFIDTAGTGSSRAKTFNVSTAAAFVIAGAGLPVAKHGSRAATSRSGSADVLTALGVNVTADSEVSEQCLNEFGICFMFAPLYHASTARVAAIRRELGVHTTFNLLGPMTNPAGAPYQIMGVWDAGLLEKVAETLQRLGLKKGWVVHGHDGLDEITVSGKTRIAEVTNENIKYFDLSPEDLGLEKAGGKDVQTLRGGGPEQNAKIIREVLENKREDAARSLVLINAAAAIYVGGRAGNLFDALASAAESLESGRALEKLELLKEKTNRKCS